MYSFNFAEMTVKSTKKDSPVNAPFAFSRYSAATENPEISLKMPVVNLPIVFRTSQCYTILKHRGRLAFAATGPDSSMSVGEIIFFKSSFWCEIIVNWLKSGYSSLHITPAFTRDYMGSFKRIGEHHFPDCLLTTFTIFGLFSAEISAVERQKTHGFISLRGQVLF